MPSLRCYYSGCLALYGCITRWQHSQYIYRALYLSVQPKMMAGSWPSISNWANKSQSQASIWPSSVELASSRCLYIVNFSIYMNIKGNEHICITYAGPHGILFQPRVGRYLASDIMGCKVKFSANMQCRCHHLGCICTVHFPLICI